GFPDYFLLRYDLAFLKQDRAGMEAAVALAQGKGDSENWIAQRQSCVLAYSGHLQEARKMSRHAVDLAGQSGQRERAGMYEAGAAVREILFGNTAEARQRAMAALKLSNGRDVEYGAGFALAFSG